MAVTREIALRQMAENEFKETRPAKLPRAYPKASDLVGHLLDDVRAAFLLPPSENDMKCLKNKFHTTVRRHRHEQERFGKKWKRGLSRIGTKAV